MRKLFFLTIFLFISILISNAQAVNAELEKNYYNSFYVEGAGSSIGITANYERVFPIKPTKSYISLGGGIGLIGFYFAPKIQANLLLGTRNFFEIGIAGFIIEETVGPALKIGYRFQRLDKPRLTFQGNIAAIYLGDDFIYLPGIAFGFSF